jgi:hypothetical protein
MRRELFLGFISFLFGTLLTLAAIEFFFVGELIVRHEWSAIFPVVLGPFFAVFAGACCWIAISSPLRWWHHRRGIYRCVRCNGVIPFRGLCGCWIAESPELARRTRLHARLPWRTGRHLQQQIPRFLGLALIPIVPALIVALNMPARNLDPLPVKFGCMYSVMLHLMGLIGIVSFDLLKRFARARRIRLRYQITSELMLACGTLLLFIAASFR